MFFLKTFILLLGNGDEENSAADTGTVNPPEHNGVDASDTSLTAWPMGCHKIVSVFYCDLRFSKKMTRSRLDLL